MKIKAILLSGLILISTIFITACKDEVTLITNQGQNSIIEDIDTYNDDLTAKEVAYSVAGKLKNINSIEAKTEGLTTAKKGVIKYDQKINNLFIKNSDEYFFEAISDSSIVKMKHQVFTKKDKLAYRNDNKGTINISTIDNYRSVYGVIPGYLNTLGWVLNEDSIILDERVESNDNTHTFRYILDNNLGTEYLKRQMKEFGDLKDYPTFEKTELVLTVDNNLNPLKLVSKASYEIKISMLGAMACQQTLTTTFSKHNEVVTIPDSKAFNDSLGETPSEIPESQIEEDNIIEELVDYLLTYNIEDGIVAKGDINLKTYNLELNIPLELALRFDLESLNSSNIEDNLFLTLKTSILGKDFALYFDGTNKDRLYFNLDDNKFYLNLNNTKEGINFDLEKIFIIEKNEDYFKFSINEAVISYINDILSEYSLEFINLDLYLHIEDSKIRYIYLEANIKNNNINTSDKIITEINIFNKDYIEPNLEGYNLLEISNNIVNNLNALSEVFKDIASLNWENGYQIDGNISLNVLATINVPITLKVLPIPNNDNLLDKFALNARIKLPVDSPLIGNFISSAIGFEVTHLDILYVGDGNIYLRFVDIKDDVETVTKMSKIALSVELDKVFNIDLNNIIGDLFKLLDDFTTTKLEKGSFKSVAGDDTLAILTEVFNMIIDFVKVNGGSSGSLFSSFFSNICNNATITTNYVDGKHKGFVINLDGLIDKGDGKEPKPVKNQIVIEFNFTKELAKDELKKDKDIIKFYESFSKANIIIEKIRSLETIFDTSNDDIVNKDTEALLKEIDKLYNELGELNSLVYNYDAYIRYKEIYEYIISEAERFTKLFDEVLLDINNVDKFLELNALYDAFNKLGYINLKSYKKAVINYLGITNYKYLIIRSDFEKSVYLNYLNDKINEINNFIINTNDDLLKLNDLLKEYDKLVNLTLSENRDFLSKQVDTGVTNLGNYLINSFNDYKNKMDFLVNKEEVTKEEVVKLDENYSAFANIYSSKINYNYKTALVKEAYNACKKYYDGNFKPLLESFNK